MLLPQRDGQLSFSIYINQLPCTDVPSNLDLSSLITICDAHQDRLQNRCDEHTR